MRCTACLFCQREYRSNPPVVQKMAERPAASFGHRIGEEHDARKKAMTPIAVSR